VIFQKPWSVFASLDNCKFKASYSNLQIIFHDSKSKAVKTTACILVII